MKANKSKERQLWNLAGFKQSHKVEKNTTYNGERPSPFSFCTQFAEVIFRLNGSVIPNVVIEISVAVALSVLAIYRFEDEKWAPIGHQIVGVLLAFLVVFRSQSAMGQYMEGRNHVEKLISDMRLIADEVLSSLAVLASKEVVAIKEGQTFEEVASKKDKEFKQAKRETVEVLRLLKLYYFATIEHCRSSEGYEPWSYAQDVMHCECLFANMPKYTFASAQASHVCNIAHTQSIRATRQIMPPHRRSRYFAPSLDHRRRILRLLRSSAVLCTQRR